MMTNKVRTKRSRLCRKRFQLSPRASVTVEKLVRRGSVSMSVEGGSGWKSRTATLSRPRPLIQPHRDSVDIERPFRCQLHLHRLIHATVNILTVPNDNRSIIQNVIRSTPPPLPIGITSQPIMTTLLVTAFFPIFLDTNGHEYRVDLYIFHSSLLAFFSLDRVAIFGKTQ